MFFFFGNPHCLSPLSYPGNKYWMIPIIEQWLNYYPGDNKIIIEPFVGSANVSMNLIKEDLVISAVINDLNDDLMAFYEVVFSNKCNELIRKIEMFHVTKANVKEQLKNNKDIIDRAFNVLLTSKVMFDCNPKSTSFRSNFKQRFNKELYIQRIRDMRQFGNKIHFYDGLYRDEFWEYFPDEKEFYYFVDAPYVKAGKNLYKHFEIDHEAIFANLSQRKSRWIMTYDDHPLIRKLAKKFKFHVIEIRNGYSRRENKNELIICRDKRWYKKVA